MIPTPIRLLCLSVLLLGVPAAAPAAQVPTAINVEVDYMATTLGGGHSHRPTRAEMDAVVAMFACQGITLTVVIDDEIPHRDVLRRHPMFVNSFFNYDDGLDTFGGIKDRFFDRGSGWHYAVFGHQYQDIKYQTSGSSGLGERPGDDFVVTLGNFFDEGGTRGTGTSWDRAATFAHELGHNLGLPHPGEPNGGEFVPNHASVMSYFYQLQGVRTGMQCHGLIAASGEETLYKELDYSHGRACTLNEFVLDEGRGMGILPVDWNCNGSVSGTVVQNLNNEGTGGSWCGSSGALGGLADYNEWSNIEDVTARPQDSYVSEEVSCVTADEMEAYRANLAALGGCPQPVPSQESCPSRRMQYVTAGGSGIPVGTCRLPFRSLSDAHTLAGDRDILYLAPGAYPATGVVLTKPMQVLGPGGAVIGD